MDLQQKQIDELASWLSSAEAKIEANSTVGSNLETVQRQIEEHKVYGVYSLLDLHDISFKL